MTLHVGTAPVIGHELPVCCTSPFRIAKLLVRLDPVAAGRPDLMGGRTSLTLYEGAVGLPENAFINVKNKSLTITADVTVPAKASGVMIVQAVILVVGHFI
jgi:hypothetical protein